MNPNGDDDSYTDEKTVRVPTAIVETDATRHVVGLIGPAAGQSYALLKEHVVIGREPESDVFIPDPFISRKHLAIHREGSQIYVEDLQAANGTVLRGRRLFFSVPIEDGELLILGDRSAVALQRRGADSSIPGGIPPDFLRALAGEHRKAADSRRPFPVLLIRIDDLISLAARYSKEVIAQLTSRVEVVVRGVASSIDHVAAFGLDQIGILVEGGEDRASKLAKKINKEIGARRFLVDDFIFSLTVSAVVIPFAPSIEEAPVEPSRLCFLATQATFLAMRDIKNQVARLDTFKP